LSTKIQNKEKLEDYQKITDFMDYHSLQVNVGLYRRQIKDIINKGAEYYNGKGWAENISCLIIK
jgi:hypothetical protein